MNAVGTSITAIKSPAAQIIEVHLIALVIKATLETALSASSITQVWSDINLQHCMLMMNSKLIYSNLFSLEPSANNARNSNNIWETQPEAVGAWSSWQRDSSSMRRNGWGV